MHGHLLRHRERHPRGSRTVLADRRSARRFDRSAYRGQRLANAARPGRPALLERSGRRLIDTAAEQSRTTHGAEEAVDACRAFAELLAEAIAGTPRADLLAPRPFEGAPAVTAIVAGRWRGRRRNDIRSSGYVVHTLEAALWSVARTGNFRNAVLLAANLADDADTVAAVTGQLAGAPLRTERHPRPCWLERIAWKDRLLGDGAALLINVRATLPRGHDVLDSHPAATAHDRGSGFDPASRIGQVLVRRYLVDEGPVRSCPVAGVGIGTDRSGVRRRRTLTASSVTSRIECIMRTAEPPTDMTSRTASASGPWVATT